MHEKLANSWKKSADFWENPEANSAWSEVGCKKNFASSFFSSVTKWKKLFFSNFTNFFVTLCGGDGCCTSKKTSSDEVGEREMKKFVKEKKRIFLR